MLKLLDFQVNGIYGTMGENHKVHTKEATYCTIDYRGLYPEKLVKVNLNVDQFRNIMKRRIKMNREQFDKLYAQDNTVVRCATEDLAREFLSLAHNLGYTWRGGDSLLAETNYYVDTVYYVRGGRVTHSTEKWSLIDKNKVIEYLGKNSRSKFKLNDKVTINDKSMVHSRFEGKVFYIEDIKKEFSFRHIYKLEGIDGAFREFELDLVPETNPLEDKIIRLNAEIRGKDQNIEHLKEQLDKRTRELGLQKRRTAGFKSMILYLEDGDHIFVGDIVEINGHEGRYKVDNVILERYDSLDIRKYIVIKTPMGNARFHMEDVNLIERGNEDES